ncbi:iron-containing alcohol dehydrogenase [Kordiimonas sp. A6E486]|nr:iron-containing alcohol dehydrogenase [Kordiimonas marina]
MADLCKLYGSKPLVVYSADLEAFANPVIADLEVAGLSPVRFAQKDPEPTCDFIDAATAELKAEAPDCVVGIGGGSAVDLAKAFAISLTQEAGIWMYANLSNRPPLPLKAPVLPVIAVPTTSGTGSEVTPYAVLTKTDTKQKGTVQEPAIFPKVALVDPVFTAGMPPALTASTGMDAFAHALEATINVSKVAPMAELFGIQAMKLILEWLPVAYEDGKNLEARQQMAFAASLAGMAISHRGTTTAHAIAEPLGALTHIPHGLGVAISTVPVLRHSLPAASASLARLWRDVMGGEALATEEAEAMAFVDALEALMTRVGLNKTVRDILGDEKCEGLRDLLVQNILEFKFRPLKQHPVEFDKAALETITADIIG